MTIQSGVNPTDVNWPEPNSVVIDIGGQSNALGLGVYVGTYPGDNRITYYVASTPNLPAVQYPFGPIPVTNLDGMELTSAPAVADATGRHIVVVKGAVSGSVIDTWIPGSGINWPAQQHAIALSRRYGMAQNYVHFAWMQGESNAADPNVSTFQAKTEQVIAGVRALYAPSPVWLHMCQINSHIGGVSNAAIAAAQAAIVASDPQSSLLNFDDVVPVNVHYTSDQFINVIGPRLAASILANL